MAVKHRVGHGPEIAIIIAAGGRPGSYVKRLTQGVRGDGQKGWIDARMLEKGSIRHRLLHEIERRGLFAPAGSEQNSGRGLVSETIAGDSGQDVAWPWRGTAFGGSA
jgi:hypothetical protein